MGACVSGKDENATPFCTCRVPAGKLCCEAVKSQIQPSWSRPGSRIAQWYRKKRRWHSWHHKDNFSIEQMGPLLQPQIKHCSRYPWNVSDFPRQSCSSQRSNATQATARQHRWGVTDLCFSTLQSNVAWNTWKCTPEYCHQRSCNWSNPRLTLECKKQRSAATG